MACFICIPDSGENEIHGYRKTIKINFTTTSTVR